MSKYLEMAVGILLIVGGLNWGLVGFFDTNLVTMLFGGTVFVKVVYGLVAAAAVYKAVGFKDGCCS